MARFVLSTLLSLGLLATAQAQISFDPAVHVPVGDRPEGGTLFDFDEDGDLDLVITSEDPDKIEFFPNFGNGVFAAPIALPTGNATSPEGLAIGDFDGDTDLDLVAALFSANEVQLIFNQGGGVFTLGGRFAVGQEPSMVVAADFDANGFADAAVNNRVSGDVSVLLNDGAGGLQPAVNYPVGIETRCVAVGNITDDALPDLAVTARDSRIVRVFKNVGGGMFQVLVNLSLGSILQPQGVTLADFDSDGKLDLVTSTSGNALQEHPSVFLQENGGNPWIGPINGQTLPGVSPMGIAAADFDLDGHVDVATANADSDNISVNKNGGIGIFTVPVIYPVGENPEALVLLAGDLDGNGGADLVSINRDSDNVSILMNRNDGPVGVETNAPATTALTLYPVSPNPFVDRASVMFELTARRRDHALDLRHCGAPLWNTRGSNDCRRAPHRNLGRSHQ